MGEICVLWRYIQVEVDSQSETIGCLLGGGQCFGGLSIILFRVRFVLKLTARMVVEVGNCFMVVCMK